MEAIWTGASEISAGRRECAVAELFGRNIKKIGSGVTRSLLSFAPYLPYHFKMHQARKWCIHRRRLEFRGQILLFLNSVKLSSFWGVLVASPGVSVISILFIISFRPIFLLDLFLARHHHSSEFYQGEPGSDWFLSYCGLSFAFTLYFRKSADVARAQPSSQRLKYELVFNLLFKPWKKTQCY